MSARARGAGWLVLAALACGARAQDPDVPYVPTPPAVVDEMLRMAKVGPGDFVIDLGSGDGRIVIAAAKRHGARGFGVDIDAGLVDTARREARRQGVAARVAFHHRNLFITEIREATVLTLYLFPGVLAQLRPRLLAELQPGTRVVSHEFDLGEWRPDERASVKVPDKPYGEPKSEVFLWVVPANAAGRWRWRYEAGGGRSVLTEVTLGQRFQMLEGTALAGGRPARLESAWLRGSEIRLRVAGEAGGAEFAGRISGDTIAGTARLDGGGEVVWNAARAAGGSAP
ncbi:MAG: class I SAM-dependent methyltransferase [Burkholderiales bacterium]|nr:class I SAM-dependent methyltransferase [Burkholderiales bacterium]